MVCVTLKRRADPLYVASIVHANSLSAANPKHLCRSSVIVVVSLDGIQSSSGDDHVIGGPEDHASTASDQGEGWGEQPRVED